ncbi:MetQ/NlpA family ABC transporter substrate-binding protein [Anaerotignum sp. MB30-C6]|uniref:MetQ/NlpA family ABC transporter substrate-binding protein n=1 Tax=Anaerotignum sp. MB30-C6 TaxID=3070814 RepID=UPI0027DBBA57|nr:MetQ/NlpA family ABC transporter substrate-binding protein [Anaerotignum sp. MB30-C6]WMI80514.1 MetQ/NlpA family ABC transporter substrate-binding protein [Anaerotignum sp. MB30-C6]
MKKNLRRLLAATLATTVVLGLAGCGASSSAEDTAQTGEDTGATVVKVGVVGEYNAQWDTVNELLADDNIQIELVKFSDYAAPNRALNDGEIDLNAFQHKAFLANDIETKGYDIVDIGDTIIAPLTIYNNKDKISSIEEVQDGDVIAIPSDLTNGGRALKLLEAAGLIECDPAKGYVPTKQDITKYNKQIEILEGESATLANILPDCTAAIINGGNALTGGLDPTTDAIFTENVDATVNEAVPQLINVIVARTADKDNELYQKVVAAYQTEEVKTTINDEYKGAFICAWENE